jgi:hypothetical protein
MSYPNVEKEQYFVKLVEKGIFEIDDLGRIWRDEERAERNHSSGYYQLFHKYKRMMAHRLVYLVKKGPIINGFIDHLDGNKLNNNPLNLDTVSRSENTKRAIEKGYTPKPIGSSNFHSKLTEKQVIKIREQYASGATQKQLSTEYHIAPNNIWGIVTGRDWRHIGGTITKGRRPNNSPVFKWPLSEEQVIDIRNSASDGELQREIANKYNMSEGAISGIIHGKSYSWWGGPIKCR